MTHLIVAYTIVLGIILGYILSLMRRQEAVRRELEALKTTSNPRSPVADKM